ncbi:uncharacterized protein ARMOST_01910 [Armillaria ostoyae]|uniref:Uncharacterized protein n=1 Tax=Armillaria ostoyae TaxID=47428 RepID=A0A284QQF7_ARMOS|nr:uncharacterized protein ARMOST_01910 [Armillaria ostoyae]
MCHNPRCSNLGGEEGTTETVTSTTAVTIPPRKKVRATVIVRSVLIGVGFTYKGRILWANGKIEENFKTGVYNNVDSWHVHIHGRIQTERYRISNTNCKRMSIRIKEILEKF